MKKHQSYPRKKRKRLNSQQWYIFSFRFLNPFVAPPRAHSDALSSRVGIHLSLSACHSNVDESTGVAGSPPLLDFTENVRRMGSG